SKFTQQELPACKPILTPRAVISAFLLVSVVFIPIGVASLLASRKVVEIVYRYESECLSKVPNKLAYIQNPTTDKTCH
ncbi:ALA-interacting subunit 3-like, partial [Trifolium medium]|nr:ALA-interacting subunit 3-like [Trifolium medium]